MGGSELAHRPLAHHPAALDEDGVVTQHFELAEDVGADQVRRGSALAGNELADLNDQFGVEAAGGLIE